MKHSGITSYPYLPYTQRSEQCVQWLLRTRPYEQEEEEGEEEKEKEMGQKQ